MLTAHFLAVADASPVPVILYSVPCNTSIDLSVEVIRICSSHSNIIGVKNSGGYGPKSFSDVTVSAV